MNKEVFAGLHIQCRSFRAESFMFETRKMCKRVFKLLSRYAFEESLRVSFAFTNTETFLGSFNGWKVYPMWLCIL